MELSFEEAKAKIKEIKNGFIDVMPDELQNLGKRAVVQTLNCSWEYFPARVEEVAEKLFRPKQYKPSEDELIWQKKHRLLR